MNNAKIILICSLLIFDSLIGCASTNESIKTSIPAVSTTQAPVTPSLSITSESPTPIVTPTVPIYTEFTLMPGPTLDADDAFGILRNYLKNQPPCQLPCWGGITPGKSTLSDVQKQLTSFSGISDEVHYGQAKDSWIVGNLDIDFTKENSTVDFGVGYLASTSSEAILFVSISTGSTESREGAVYASRDYNELFFAYTLPQIVSTYGLPVQTFMTAEIYVAEPTAPDFFVIRLLYPELGIFVRYKMPAETGHSNYKFCPSESLVDLDLIPQGHANDYKDLFKHRGTVEWSPASPVTPFYKSTEEVLGITDEEFFRLIVSSPNRCFESPINIWPEP